MSRVFVIAEAGVNHNGDLEMARRLVRQAARAGADAVKFQTFKAQAIASASAAKADYQLRTTDAGQSQLDMLRALELSAEAHRELMALCRELGLEFLSTPFDLESLDLLVSLGVSRLKLPSGELTNAPLLLAAARSGLPLLVSTGMARLGEVEDALGVLAFGMLGRKDPPGLAAFRAAYADPLAQAVLAARVTLLHCTTEYPAPFEDVNLAVLATMRQAFGLACGYSDHTEGLAVSLAAVALGACVLEKHFTLDRDLPGPDHKASIEPEELVDLVRQVRQVEAALGSAPKRPAPSEAANALVARKSLVAARPVAPGEAFTPENLAVKRPGSGISPMEYFDRLGRTAQRAYEADELIEP
ncbi:MAG: N-acetylneuraminate synthase [Desulfovibrionaceae bacterium]